ncbi:MAG: alpha/beta hydrolase-fold protein [Aureliella sp.]
MQNLLYTIRPFAKKLRNNAGPFSCLLTIVLFGTNLSTTAFADETTPQGKLTTATFDDSQIFPGTTREYSVYIPKEYDSNKPANLMVFMDGRGYLNAKGAFRVPSVFDALIEKSRMPVTVAVFINPGKIEAKIEDGKSRSNRSFEYDSLGNRYSRFLLEELLPEALKGINISNDPKNRAVCGISSSGICSFTVAWERPDAFGKVMSHIGSFTNIRGGWAYPGLIRKSHRKPKPIKVYLQDGVNDLDNLHGSWPLGNQDMAAALQFAGYHYKLELTDGGHSGKWAGEVFSNALEWLWDEDSVSTQIPDPGTRPKWSPPPESIEKDDVPTGTVTKMPAFESEKVFAGTIRDWWIYVPAQYKADTPAALMVFQDGQGMQSRWRWRIPTVFDHLIASGEMPATIGVFINPGHEKNKPRRNGKHSNRGFEYDSLGDRYATFLIDEILPVVQQKYNLSDDPEMHAIGGSSSGGICAFNVAWERPDVFRRVFTSVGSFTHLRGGNIFPALVRKTEPKPIRVYMADTSGDVDNAFGSWPIANQRMAAALSYMGYDSRFDWAEGYGHNADFGSQQFPEAMRWLWRADSHTPEINTEDDLGGDLTLLDLLIPDQTWEIAADNLGFADALCVAPNGDLLFSDMRASKIFRHNPATDENSIVANESVSGLEFNRDGTKLYACQGAKNRLIEIDPTTGNSRTVATGFKPNDLEVTNSGHILFTHTAKSEVVRVDPDSGEAKSVATGIAKPNGITLSPDGGTLAVSEYGGKVTWTFRVLEDGSLDAQMPTMTLRCPIDMNGDFAFNEEPPYKSSAKGDGMTVDRIGRFYVTSELGIQIFDPTGRPCGLLPKPDKDKPLTTCAIAGSDRNTLFIAQGGKIYKRKLTIERPKRN